MNYTGEQCFLCGNTFADKDDVVVCPECGTPYHRECYKNAGQCVNKILHESNEGWQRTNSDENAAEKKPEYKVCPKCFSRNEPSAENCSECGHKFLDNNINNSSRSGTKPDINLIFEGFDTTKEYLGFNPEEDLGGAKLKEVTEFVDTNTLYYIPIFKRMKDIGSKISFNIICLFFPYFYFANRKMWFWAILTAFMSALLNIPSLLYFIGSQDVVYPFMSSITDFLYSNKNLFLSLSDICGLVSWGIRIFACLFGNWLYLKFAVRSVNKLKAHYGGPVSPQKLKSKGGISLVNVFVMGIIFLALSFAIYFLIMFVLVFMQSSGII